MPIPLPNLDDRDFAELTAEAATLIPGLDPLWTNYNPSDPGITLVELLAWLTEMLIFQVNAIPPASTEKFLTLLNGRDWVWPPGASLDTVVGQTIRRLRERYRAVTAADFEWLALHDWPLTPEAAALPNGGRLARAHCLPRRNLDATDPEARRAQAPSHVSLVIVPAPEVRPFQEAALREALSRFFDERRTLTTRQHVVGARYVAVRIAAKLALLGGAPPSEAIERARADLEAHYDPLAGGPDRRGWPFGRAVYPSEVSAVLERAWMVDYVEDIQVTRAETPPATAGPAPVADGAVELEADEIVGPVFTELTGYDSHGRRQR